ncbi:MAG: hypothetical protein GXP02_07995 [Alphaproteobacteria bacterium]|nr:hypothetical protein [Alphaproteobacteria bacterium]
MTAKNWLDKVIDDAQKEVNTWDSYRKESMQREVERTYHPDVTTSSNSQNNQKHKSEQASHKSL